MVAGGYSIPHRGKLKSNFNMSPPKGDTRMPLKKRLKAHHSRAHGAKVSSKKGNLMQADLKEMALRAFSNTNSQSLERHSRPRGELILDTQTTINADSIQSEVQSRSIIQELRKGNSILKKSKR